MRVDFIIGVDFGFAKPFEFILVEGGAGMRVDRRTTHYKLYPPFPGGVTFLTEVLDKMDHNEYWRTKNGRAIAIKDMPTGHLRNAIAMLRRNTPSREAPEFYWEELKVGYSAMVEELERRKLEESVRLQNAVAVEALFGLIFGKKEKEETKVGNELFGTKGEDSYMTVTGKSLKEGHTATKVEGKIYATSDLVHGRILKVSKREEIPLYDILPYDRSVLTRCSLKSVVNIASKLTKDGWTLEINIKAYEIKEVEHLEFKPW